jgi:3-hydroxy acid dehydrogenase / malonic semialdehyde reductase
MKSKMTAFITGASSGIGLACAERFAAAGWNLMLIARRKEKLDELKQTFEKQHTVKVLTLAHDVRSLNTVEIIGKFMHDSNCTPDLLINNAGLAVGINPVQSGIVDDWERMIDTNVKGLIYVTRAVVPTMIAAGSGHIINIGSIAGKEVYPGGNVYSATKYAVDGFTKSIRIDLLPYQIKVTQIAPGATDTEFSLVRYKGDAERAKNVYNGYKPLSGADVAEAVWFAANLPPHVNVNDMLLMPTAQAGSVHFHKD